MFPIHNFRLFTVLFFEAADHSNIVKRFMDPSSEFTSTRYHRSPSPYRHGDASPPHPKLAGISSTSGPVSFSNKVDIRFYIVTSF